MAVALLMVGLIVLVFAVAFIAQNRDLRMDMQRANGPAQKPAQPAPPPVPQARPAERSPVTGTTRLAIPRELVPKPAAQTPLATVRRSSAQVTASPPRELVEAITLLALTSQSVDKLSSQLSDRVTMRAEMLAVEQQLGELHVKLNADPALIPTVTVEATRLTNKLKRLKNDAALVAEDYATLLTSETRLRREANMFHAALDELAEQLLFPIAWGTTSAISRAALRLANDGGGQTTLTSHDQIKRRLGLIKGLLADIEQGKTNLATVRNQRERLVQLLTTPELAEQPAWYKAIAQLTSRLLAQQPNQAAALELRNGAQAALERRRLLFAGCPESAHGSVILAEEKVPGLLQEAQAIQQAVRRLWVAAREIVGK
jgi:hypothetical protein